MKQLLVFIVKNLIGDKFTVDELVEDSKVTFTLNVPKDKMGIVIGKSGRMIKSIQDLLRIKATLEKKFIFINIQET